MDSSCIVIQVDRVISLASYANKTDLFINSENAGICVHLVRTLVYKYKIQFLNEHKNLLAFQFFAFILHQPRT